MIQIKIKRGLESALASAGVIAGELKFCTDSEKLYVGNGTKNVCLNNIIQPTSTLNITAADVSTNRLYLLTADYLTYKAGMYYATVSGSVVNWHEVGSSVTWANITGNVSDNTALWNILGNVATLKTTAKSLTPAINELFDMVEGIGSGMTYKGTVNTRADLPVSGQENGDLWFIKAETVNVIWNATTEEWDDLGGAIDISGKVDKTQTIAGIDLSANIPAEDLRTALGLGSALKYKGVVATVADLSLITVKEIGDLYYVTENGASYAWNGTEWQSLGNVIDISEYQKKQDNTLATTAKTVVGAIAELKQDGVGNIVKFVYDNTNYKLKAQLYKSDGTTLISETAEIDLPLEELIVSIEYVASIPEGTYAGKPGLKITLKSGSVTYAPLDAMIAGMVTETGTQTLTNKTIDADDNTILDLETDNFKSGVISTDIAAAASASDSKLVSEKAVRTELDTKFDAQAEVSDANKFVFTDASGNVGFTDTPGYGTLDGGTF